MSGEANGGDVLHDQTQKSLTYDAKKTDIMIMEIKFQAHYDNSAKITLVAFHLQITILKNFYNSNVKLLKVYIQPYFTGDKRKGQEFLRYQRDDVCIQIDSKLQYK